jgi:hypothetical protein
MVFTVAVRPHRPERWTRRVVLATGATSLAGAATGCGWFRSGPPEPDPPDPLEPLLTATRDLVDRYARTLVRHPDLAGRLDALHDTHAVHVTALLAVIGRPELATPSPGPSPGRSASPTPSAIPSEPDEAIDELTNREQEALAAAREACLASPVERIELLGSLCAARASHLEVLA